MNTSGAELTKMPSRRRPKRERHEQQPPAPEIVTEDISEGDVMPRKDKRVKADQNDVFSSYMMDDTFLLLLRFFVSEAGLVDGDSLRSIMLVSKRWYKAANTKSLWTIPEVQHASKENFVPYVPRRPSPFIREMRTFLAVNGDNYSNALIGFQNLGRRNTNDGRPSFNIRERATRKLFFIDILDADDECAVQEAASAHHLIGNTFLTSQQEGSQHLFLPIGMESSNGKVVCWFNQATPILTSPPPLLEDAKTWIRQLLLAVQYIHSTDAMHGCIHPKNIYVDASNNSKTAIQLLCPSLFPIVSFLQPPGNEVTYLSPELLIPLSTGLKVLPSREGDMWAVGCIFAELIHGKPLFGQLSDSWNGDGKTNSLMLYVRKICQVVGRPPAFFKSMRSHRHDEFPNDPMLNLRRVLYTLDEVGLDLVSKLLSPDPERRPTAEEALAHPFLSEKSCAQPVSFSMNDSTHREKTRVFLHMSRETPLMTTSPVKKHVRSDAWATLVDYVIEIVEVFDLDIEAAFRAMSYFDRFFSSYQGSGTFSNRRCQLVAGTCLYIACKCFETRLTKGDLVFSADNMLNANDVAIAEEVILHELDWKLSYPTIHDFVEMFTDELGLEEESKQRRMARYISELALQSQVYLSFKPSLIASCVVALALVAVGSVDPWPDGLKQATGYSWNDLELCMMALSSGIHHVSATMPELKIISRRYRKTQNGRLSLIHIPRITLFASLRTPRA